VIAAETVDAMAAGIAVATEAEILVAAASLAAIADQAADRRGCEAEIAVAISAAVALAVDLVSAVVPDGAAARFRWRTRMGRRLRWRPRLEWRWRERRQQ